jgi:MFS family permease
LISGSAISAGCPVQEPFDLGGAALAALALTSFLVGLSEIDRRGIASPFVVGAVALALVAGISFLGLERRLEHPMVDLRLFASRAFSAGVGSAVLSYMSLFAITFTMPFYLLQVRGIDPALAGIILTATPLSMALFSPVAGRLSDLWGSRGLATGGMAWLTLSIAVASRLETATPLMLVAAVLFSIGAGLSVFTAPNTAGILRATPGNRVGVGSALTAQARSLGMTLGIAVTAAVVSTLLGGRELMDGGGALSAADASAFMEALQPALVVAAVVAGAGAVVSWLRGNDRVVHAEVEPPQDVP